MILDRGVYVVTAGLPHSLGACWSCGSSLPKHYGGDCEECIKLREAHLLTVPKNIGGHIMAMEEVAKKKANESSKKKEKGAKKSIEELMPLFAQQAHQK